MSTEYVGAENVGAEHRGPGRGRPRRPRNQRGQGSRLRDELVQAARRLLATSTRESDVSIRAVTREAGAAPQSFYLQFASIDELLYAVYEIEFEQLRKEMLAAASQAVSPAGRLQAVCVAYCRYAQEQPGRYWALTSVHGQPEHGGWEGQPLPGTPAFVVIRDAVTAALDSAGSRADPFVTTATLWACLHGMVTLRASRPAFPWPALDDMIASLLGQLGGAALPESDLGFRSNATAPVRHTPVYAPGTHVRLARH